MVQSCQKSRIMPLRFDLMFLAASLRMTVTTLTGIVKTCSTLRFPPERISQKDFPSMCATWTPTLSLGGNITFGGNYWVKHISPTGYKRKSPRHGRLLFLKVCFFNPPPFWFEFCLILINHSFHFQVWRLPWKCTKQRGKSRISFIKYFGRSGFSLFLEIKA